MRCGSNSATISELENEAAARAIDMFLSGLGAHATVVQVSAGASVATAVTSPPNTAVPNRGMLSSANRLVPVGEYPCAFCQLTQTVSPGTRYAVAKDARSAHAPRPVPDVSQLRDISSYGRSPQWHCPSNIDLAQISELASPIFFLARFLIADPRNAVLYPCRHLGTFHAADFGSAQIWRVDIRSPRRDRCCAIDSCRAQWKDATDHAFDGGNRDCR
jgi:hypothetical protein